VPDDIVLQTTRGRQNEYSLMFRGVIVGSGEFADVVASTTAEYQIMCPSSLSFFYCYVHFCYKGKGKGAYT